MHRYAIDPEVTRYTDWGPNREADTKVFLAQALAAQRRRPRKQFDLAVVLKQVGHLIGGCGLHLTQPHRNEGYLGYWLGRPFWGNGYATETLESLLTLGFEGLELHRIFAYCSPENVSSIRCWRKSACDRKAVCASTRGSTACGRTCFSTPSSPANGGGLVLIRKV